MFTIWQDRSIPYRRLRAARLDDSFTRAPVALSSACSARANFHLYNYRRERQNDEQHGNRRAVASRRCSDRTSGITGYRQYGPNVRFGLLPPRYDMHVFYQTGTIEAVLAKSLPSPVGGDRCIGRYSIVLDWRSGMRCN